MRLHIGILGTKERFDALQGYIFHLINNLASTIVAPARIAFCIFIGEHGAHGIHHLLTREILGSDQLQAFSLTLVLCFDQLKDLKVSFHGTVGFWVYIFGQN